ncbi:MAG: tail fiber domain-containing protein [Bacteroidota bacterium]
MHTKLPSFLVTKAGCTVITALFIIFPTAIPWLAAQNVGIGTNTPEQKLHVFNATAAARLKIETAAADSAGLQIFTPTNSWDIVTSAPGHSLDVTNATSLLQFTSGGALLLTGDAVNGVTPTSGGGRRFMWIPEKAAIRAGSVTTTNWDADSIGLGSVAMGINAKARGAGSVSFGANSYVWADNSQAFGDAANVISGTGQTAVGRSASVNSFSASCAMGALASATGDRAHAYGLVSTGDGPFGYGQAFGLLASATGDFSTAHGNSVTSSGSYSVALGGNAVASGVSSLAMNTYGFSTPVLTNNVPNSVMIAASSSVPSITILQNGAAASGFVGVGSTTPGFRLQVGNLGDGSVAVANAWNTFSDLRLKKNLAPTVDLTASVLALGTYTYQWKAASDQSWQIGFIAQEVQQLFPSVVSEGKDGILTVDYSRLVVPLWHTTKELYGQVQELKRG